MQYLRPTFPVHVTESPLLPAWSLFSLLFFLCFSVFGRDLKEGERGREREWRIKERGRKGERRDWENCSFHGGQTTEREGEKGARKKAGTHISFGITLSMTYFLQRSLPITILFINELIDWWNYCLHNSGWGSRLPCTTFCRYSSQLSYDNAHREGRVLLSSNTTLSS